MNSNLETFYNSLNDIQKEKVENKVRKLLGEQFDSIPEADVNRIRHQVAQDIFHILKG